MLCQSLYYKDSYSRIILELQLTLEAIYQQIPNCAVCSLKDPVGSPHTPSGLWSRMGGELELPPHVTPLYLYFSQLLFYRFYLFLHLGKFLLENGCYTKKKKVAKQKLKISLKTTGNPTPLFSSGEHILAHLGEMICLRTQNKAQQS